MHLIRAAASLLKGTNSGDSITQKVGVGYFGANINVGNKDSRCMQGAVLL